MVKCSMATKFKVKKIAEGIYKGQYGVYQGKTLMIAFKTKGAATTDANRRNSATEEKA
jgi:hypothetical protein